MKRYFGDFCCEAQICKQFETEKIPFMVMFASYDVEGYEAEAFVLLMQPGATSPRKLFEVNAVHCSCFGLEGQWNPEETTIATVRARSFSFMDEETRAALHSILDEIETKGW